ncbi:MAG: hypothetical protein NC453_29565 [Muribaculum sp.]|nr:hypothetical protein [Muribaculum sp.]
MIRTKDDSKITIDTHLRNLWGTKPIETRLINNLLCANCETVGDAAEVDIQKFSELQTVGAVTIKELIKFQKKYCMGFANLSDARSLAYEVHKGQIDKGGTPYYNHPDRVAKRCETEDEKIVAYLHDTIEDTEVTPELLKEKGFSQRIIDAVLSVTKIEGESYEDFVARAKQNPIGRMVKIHDLEDNMDVSRLSELDDNAVERLRKYLKAYHFLKA